MASSSRKQIITRHALLSIQSKPIQTITFSQFIEYDMKNHTKNDVGRVVPDLFFFLNKTLHVVKASGRHLTFNIFWQSSS